MIGDAYSGYGTYRAFSSSGCPLCRAGANWGGMALTKTGLVDPVAMGRTPLPSFLHATIERFPFADSRKISPRRMFRHPTEKRSIAAPRVKSSTWWERIWAPIRHWKIPRAPNPNLLPSTGKKRSKNFIGQLSSETSAIAICQDPLEETDTCGGYSRRRTMIGKMMSRDETTAQKTPAAWLGTVLPLFRVV